jgi:glycosyltransferase involved in cell wall biosynthesis
MKLLIATGLYPPDIGGPATMIEALAEALQERGFEIRIVTYADCLEAMTEEDKNGIIIYRISRKLSRLLRHIFYFFKMWKLAAKWADIVYVTDTYSVGYFTYLIKKLLQKKYIVRFAGDSAWETSVANGWITDSIIDFQNKKYCGKIEDLKRRRKTVLINADRVIVVSHFLADIARKVGVLPERIRIIYNSIDFLETGENVEKTRQIRQSYGGDKKLIITACRLTLWKGVAKIIEILPQLKEAVGDVNFLVLGDGPEMENLKKMAVGRGLGEAVHFLGKIDHGEILDYFRAADLFILNSNYEGLSHTLLEVMRAGAPIVTTKVGGNPEVIENEKDGLLIGYNNEAELLEAATRILTDSKLAERLVENARQKLKDFNWETVVAKTAAAINEIYKKEAPLN